MVKSLLTTWPVLAPDRGAVPRVHRGEQKRKEEVRLLRLFAAQEGPGTIPYIH